MKLLVFVPNVVDFKFMQNILKEKSGVLVSAETIGHNQDQRAPASLNKSPKWTSNNNTCNYTQDTSDN